MGPTIVSAALIAAFAVAGLCSVVPAASAGVGPLIVGGWRPISNVNDPHIQELGRWAVAEHVRLVNDGLRFNKVVRGEQQVVVVQQVVVGMVYRLILDVTNRGGKDATYAAGVYEKGSTKKRQLLSFDPAN